MNEIQNLFETQGLPEWILERYAITGHTLTKKHINACLTAHPTFSNSPENIKMVEAATWLALEKRDKAWLAEPDCQQNPGCRRIRMGVRKAVSDWAREITKEHIRTVYAGRIWIELTVNPEACQTVLGRFLAEHVSSTVPGDIGGRVALGTAQNNGTYNAFAWPPMEDLNAARYFDRCAEAIEATGNPLLDVAGAGVPSARGRARIWPRPRDLKQAVQDGDREALRAFWETVRTKGKGRVPRKAVSDTMETSACLNPDLLTEIIHDIPITEGGVEALIQESEKTLGHAARIGHLPVVETLIDFVSDLSPAMHWSVLRLAFPMEDAEEEKGPGRWEQGLNKMHRAIFEVLLDRKALITLEHIEIARENPNCSFAAELESLKAAQDAAIFSEHLDEKLPSPSETPTRQRL